MTVFSLLDRSGGKRKKMIDNKTFRHHEYPRIMITIVEQHCKRMEFFQIDHGGVKVNQP